MATAASRIAGEFPRDPASFPSAFAYEHTDVPPGLSLADYRRARRHCGSHTVRGIVQSLVRRLGGRERRR